MNNEIPIRVMESDTPETNAKEWPIWPPNSHGEMFVVPSDFARKLERERDELCERYKSALQERDSWRNRAEEKWAIRRELEELLGVDHAAASDKQFKKGFDRLNEIIQERDEASEVAAMLADYLENPAYGVEQAIHKMEVMERYKQMKGDK
jgi:uncharacterized coiled-coil DUF342 family protein